MLVVAPRDVSLVTVVICQRLRASRVQQLGLAARELIFSDRCVDTAPLVMGWRPVDCES